MYGASTPLTVVALFFSTIYAEEEIQPAIGAAGLPKMCLMVVKLLDGTLMLASGILPSVPSGS
jgi:hypothetical protein